MNQNEEDQQTPTAELEKANETQMDKEYRFEKIKQEFQYKMKEFRNKTKWREIEFTKKLKEQMMVLQMNDAYVQLTEQSVGRLKNFLKEHEHDRTDQEFQTISQMSHRALLDLNDLMKEMYPFTQLRKLFPEIEKQIEPSLMAMLGDSQHISSKDRNVMNFVRNRSLNIITRKNLSTVSLASSTDSTQSLTDLENSSPSAVSLKYDQSPIYQFHFRGLNLAPIPKSPRRTPRKQTEALLSTTSTPLDVASPSIQESSITPSSTTPSLAPSSISQPDESTISQKEDNVSAMSEEKGKEEVEDVQDDSMSTTTSTESFSSDDEELDNVAAEIFGTKNVINVVNNTIQNVQNHKHVHHVHHHHHYHSNLTTPYVNPFELKNMNEEEINRHFRTMLTEYGYSDPQVLKNLIDTHPISMKMEMIKNFYKIRNSDKTYFYEIDKFMSEPYITMEHVRRIKIILLTRNKSLLDYFISINGALKLAHALAHTLTTLSKSKDSHSILEQQMDLVIILKAICSQMNGLKQCAEKRQITSQFVFLLQSKSLRIRVYMMHIFAEICGFNEQGFLNVYHSFQHLKFVKGLSSPFVILMDGLNRFRSIPEYVEATLVLLISLVNNATDVELPFKLRSEFLNLGVLRLLNSILETCDFGSEDLTLKLQQFMRELAEDYMIDPKHLNDPQKLVSLLQLRLSSSELEPYLVSFLQFLLLSIENNGSTKDSDLIAKWQVLDKIIRKSMISHKFGEAALQDTSLNEIVLQERVATQQQIIHDLETKAYKQKQILFQYLETFYDDSPPPIDEEELLNHELAKELITFMEPMRNFKGLIKEVEKLKEELEKEKSKVGLLKEGKDISHLEVKEEPPPEDAPPPPPPPFGDAPPPPPGMDGPPPPPGGAMGPALPNMNTMKKPTKPVRQFMWTEISKFKVVKTIFILENIAKNSLKFDINIEKLQEVFSNEKEEKPVGDENKPAEGGPAKKKQIISVLDSKRSYNLNIILKNVKKNRDDLRRYILAMDETNITPDELDILNSAAPTSEEIDAIKNYKDDMTVLGEADLYFHSIKEIPNFQQRVETWKFKLKFWNLVAGLRCDLDDLLAAIKEVMTSKKYIQLITAVLAIGNFLNGTKKVSYGFKVNETLLKLKDTKGKDKKTSVLDYLVELLKEKQTPILEFFSELTHVPKAAKADTTRFKEDLKEVTEGIRKIRNLLDYYKDNQDNPDDQYPGIMTSFEEKASFELNTIEEKNSLLVSELEHLGTFYGENEVDLIQNPAGFFAQVVEFNGMFKLAEQKYEAKKKAEEQKRIKEEQARLKEEQARLKKEQKEREEQERLNNPNFDAEQAEAKKQKKTSASKPPPEEQKISEEDAKKVLDPTRLKKRESSTDTKPKEEEKELPKVQLKSSQKNPTKKQEETKNPLGAAVLKKTNLAKKEAQNNKGEAPTAKKNSKPIQLAPKGEREEGVAILSLDDILKDIKVDLGPLDFGSLIDNIVFEEEFDPFGPKKKPKSEATSASKQSSNSMSFSKFNTNLSKKPSMSSVSKQNSWGSSSTTTKSSSFGAKSNNKSSSSSNSKGSKSTVGKNAKKPMVIESNGFEFDLSFDDTEAFEMPPGLQISSKLLDSLDKSPQQPTQTSATQSKQQTSTTTTQNQKQSSSVTTPIPKSVLSNATNEPKEKPSIMNKFLESIKASSVTPSAASPFAMDSPDLIPMKREGQQQQVEKMLNKKSVDRLPEPEVIPLDVLDFDLDINIADLQFDDIFMDEMTGVNKASPPLGPSLIASEHLYESPSLQPAVTEATKHKLHKEPLTITTENLQHYEDLLSLTPDLLLIEDELDLDNLELSLE